MTSDQRVRVSFGYVYPDVVVACEPSYEDTRPRTLENPELIVEVTSDATKARDQGDKLAAYTELESLREYWIIDPDKSLLAQYTRGEDGWQYRAHTALADTIVSDAFDLDVPLRDLYALVRSDAE
jgi:Uma2 family endonuclease